MGRPKEFNRDVALRQAMGLFWDQGYEATSTDDLARVMGIGRQSLYDTFGNKRAIYLEALKLYAQEQGDQLHEWLRQMTSPLRAVEAALQSIGMKSPAERLRCCLMVNATAECAPSDHEVLAIVRANTVHCEALFASAVRAAQDRGELPAALDAHAAGGFLLATMRGLGISAKAGASAKALNAAAHMAMAGLGARVADGS